MAAGFMLLGVWFTVQGAGSGCRDWGYGLSLKFRVWGGGWRGALVKRARLERAMRSVMVRYVDVDASSAT